MNNESHYIAKLKSSSGWLLYDGLKEELKVVSRKYTPVDYRLTYALFGE